LLQHATERVMKAGYSVHTKPQLRMFYPVAKNLVHSTCHRYYSVDKGCRNQGFLTTNNLKLHIIFNHCFDTLP